MGDAFYKDVKPAVQALERDVTDERAGEACGGDLETEESFRVLLGHVLLVACCSVAQARSRKLGRSSSVTLQLGRAAARASSAETESSGRAAQKRRAAAVVPLRERIRWPPIRLRQSPESRVAIGHQEVMNP